MATPDPATFFKFLGMNMLIIAMGCGLVYWIVVLTKKFKPDFRWWFKYKFMHRKYDEVMVAGLMEDLENDVDEDELLRSIILSNKADPIKAREMKWVYSELKKCKGGKKNE